MKKLWLLVFVGIFVGCGDSNQDLTNTGLVKDVRLVPYNLKKVEVEAEFEFEDGVIQRHESEVVARSGDSKDKVLKTVENDRFVLYINETRSNIAVAASGEIQYQGRVDVETKGCKLNGRSSVGGKAIHNEVRLDWELSVELEGQGCTSEMVEDYLQFQDEEIAALNLTTLNDVLAPLKDEMAETVRVRLKVRLFGDSE